MEAMMGMANALTGKLTWQALQHNAVTTGGVIIMTLSLLVIVAGLTYFKRWKWLWREWLTSLDPKKIGVMYIVTALIMLLRGISDAVLMRAQQATSAGTSHGLLPADQFQQIFSAHGTIMIFFAAMGLMFGLINLVLPLQLGARDVAFPFMNSASFWLYAAGAALINVSLAVGEFSAAGWLAYPPLSELQFSPSVGVDYWIWGLQIAGIGSLLSGVNFLVTIIKMRAPGMGLMKMPVFAWSVLGSMSLVAFAFPILTVTLTLLFLDRTLGMHFFTAGGGGNAMMYVNLIWAWGHPEVYILILPAFGVFSEVVPTFSQKRLFGYTSMVWAIWGIVLLSFLVWLHHFFTMGAGADVNAFFGIMTMVIAVPTGVKMFNWLFTMYRGRIRFKTPMLWFMGFVVLFTIGGVAGVLLAVPPADFQLHNSLFLVAHFHTMIVSGVLFGYFAGLTYWFPKIFGFRLNERLGKYAFWCWLVGFVLAFVPLYILGLMGATRRLDHYSASLGWQPLFIVAGVGVAIVVLGIGFQILQLIVSIVLRSRTMDLTGDPWNGRTLEWATSSPPPSYNFAIIPEVTERDALWAMKQQTKKGHLKAHVKHDSVQAEASALPESVNTSVAAESPESSRMTIHYADIHMPKNTGLGVIVAGFALLFGFAMVWHIWWLGAIGLVGAIASIIIRTADEHTEYVVKAADISAIEVRRKRTYA